jgi:hypothetical protein
VIVRRSDFVPSRAAESPAILLRLNRQLRHSQPTNFEGYVKESSLRVRVKVESEISEFQPSSIGTSKV